MGACALAPPVPGYSGWRAGYPRTWHRSCLGRADLRHPASGTRAEHGDDGCDDDHRHRPRNASGLPAGGASLSRSRCHRSSCRFTDRVAAGGSGIALLTAFGRNGLVGQWLAQSGVTVGFTIIAVVMAQLFVSAPFYVIAARGGFARVDSDVEAAAADLGATPGQVFRTVTLPLIAPSLIAGAVLAWARALGEFGATIMFAGNFPGVTQTMPLAIYSRFGAGDLSTALLLSVILLIASIAVLLGVRIVGARVRDSY